MTPMAATASTPSLKTRIRSAGAAFSKSARRVSSLAWSVSLAVMFWSDWETAALDVRGDSPEMRVQFASACSVSCAWFFRKDLRVSLKKSL